MATGAVPARISLASASLAAGLEYEPDTDSQRVRLALDLAASNDFSSGLGELTEVDSGANVNVTGGKLEINGASSLDANGVYLTTPVSKNIPGKFSIKMTPRDNGLGMMVGFAAGAALDYNAAALPRVWFDNAAGIEIYTTTIIEIYHATQTLAVGTEYTIECEWDAGTTLAIYITGGAFTTKTLIVQLVKSDLAATFGFEINAYTQHADAWEFDDFERYSGYKTTSPVATLADIDSGEDDSVWDMSTIAFAGSETNLTFSYAYGNSASPSNWSAYKTLAQLQAESDVTGRYFKLRIAAASDGATQVEITEGNINVGVAAGSARSRPALTLADPGTGTSLTATVAGTGGGTVQFWHRRWSAKDGWGAWADGLTRTGNGAKTISGLSAGRYEVMAAELNANGVGYGPAAAGRIDITAATATLEPGAAVVYLLEQDATLAALVAPGASDADHGDIDLRIYHGTVDGKCPRDAGRVVWHMISAPEAKHLLSGAGAAKTRIQVDCIAKTRAGAIALAAAVRGALHGYTGTVSTADGKLRVDGIHLEDQHDDPAPPADGSARGPSCITQDYIVAHATTIPTFG